MTRLCRDGSVASQRYQAALVEVCTQTCKRGVLGLPMTRVSVFLAVIVGALNDRFMGTLKTTILVSYVLTSVCFTAFGLLVLKLWVPPEGSLIPLIYASAIGGGFFLYCPIPLFFEMVVEETYPRIPAATSSGVLSIMVTVCPHDPEISATTNCSTCARLSLGGSNCISVCADGATDELGNEAGHTPMHFPNALALNQVSKDTRRSKSQHCQA